MATFLNEINEFTYNVEELNEDGMPKKFILKGRFQHSGIPNGNGRSYPKPVLESALKLVNESVAERRMLGELDHPADAKIHLDKVSHVITKLAMEESGEVYGEAEVLPTASGKILESLIKAGVKLGISSRGFGSTVNKNGLQEVQDDYKLVTFDIVSDPSTPGAFPKPVYEDKDTLISSEEENTEYVTTLGSLLNDIVNEDITIEKEQKEFICNDTKSNRFYLVSEGKDSYGNFTFHASHDYHVLVKNEDFQERIGLSEDNLDLMRDVYGERVYTKINETIEDLGYDSRTLNLKREEF